MTGQKCYHFVNLKAQHIEPIYRRLGRAGHHQCATHRWSSLIARTTAWGTDGL